jgi:hypothetical protein
MALAKRERLLMMMDNKIGEAGNVINHFSISLT